MPRSLRAEIKQDKPFTSLAQETYLNIERTAAVLGHALAESLKPYGITPTQYNVLRILRGAGPKGLSRNDIRDRMIALVPDVTRLVDRLEEAGLVERERDAADRRQVASRITAAGLELLRSLDAPVQEMHERLLGHLPAAQLRLLSDLMEQAREAVS